MNSYSDRVFSLKNLIFIVLLLSVSLTNSLGYSKSIDESILAPEASSPSQKSIKINSGLIEKGYYDPERGWFFYETKPEPEEDVFYYPPKSKLPPPKKEEKKKSKSKEVKKEPVDPCTKMSTWKPECGFVDPGKSFEFQAKQRDMLFQRMTMEPENPKAVEDLQYYVKWVYEKATMATRMAEFNRAQNPDLDPSAYAPISAFGIRLASEVKDARSENMFKFLQNEGAFLVYFTRDDCVYCHHMLPTIKNVSSATGLKVWNASLDNKCLIKDSSLCLTAPETIGPAQALKVSTVPALFVYVPDNTWIRVSNGVSSESRIKSRIVTFLTGYRSALLKGVGEGKDSYPEGYTKVDFGDNRKPFDFGLQKGVSLEPGDTKGVDSSDMLKFMGLK